MSIMSILSIMSIIFFSDVSKLYIIVCPDKNEQQFLFNFMLEGRDILHFISFHVMFFWFWLSMTQHAQSGAEHQHSTLPYLGIHSSVWSTLTILYDIREPRYKQNKMGYQIQKILGIGQSCVLKSDVQYGFPYISAPLCCTEMGLNLKHA